MEKTITGLEPQKRNPNRINVYLDDEFAFGISRFVGAWLKEGATLNSERVTQLLEKDAHEKAYQKALKFISFKPRSAFEVRKRLKDKGFDEATIDPVLADLEEKLYLNDGEFAQNWVETRSRSKPRSRRMLKYELRKKSIDDAIIEKSVNSAPADFDLGIKLGKKYLKRYAHLDDQSFKKRMTGVLARRMFPFPVIKDVIIKLLELRNTNTD